MTTRSFGLTSTGKWTPHGAFLQVVAPAMTAAGLLPRGHLTDAEGTSQDQRAGIDWIISGADGTQTTIASRVQWHTDWGTFSVRYRTERNTMSELTKRYRSILERGSYPTLTVQAYVTQPGGVLINAYVIRTEDLYRHFVIPAPDGDPEHFTLCGCAGAPIWAPGGAQFIPVAISEEGKMHSNTRSTLIACGVPVASFRPINEGRGLWTA
jgi:hypothetical protein